MNTNKLTSYMAKQYNQLHIINNMIEVVIYVVLIFVGIALYVRNIVRNADSFRIHPTNC